MQRSGTARYARDGRYLLEHCATLDDAIITPPSPRLVTATAYRQKTIFPRRVTPRCTFVSRRGVISKERAFRDTRMTFTLKEYSHVNSVFNLTRRFVSSIIGSFSSGLTLLVTDLSFNRTIWIFFSLDLVGVLELDET